MRKKHHHLWPEITAFDNLLLAFRKAAKGKRSKPAVASFEYDLERNLLTLQAELALDKFRLYWRLSHARGLITLHQYQYVAEQLTEIGRLLGGWIRSLSSLHARMRRVGLHGKFPMRCCACCEGERQPSPSGSLCAVRQI